MNRYIWRNGLGLRIAYVIRFAQHTHLSFEMHFIFHTLHLSVLFPRHYWKNTIAENSVKHGIAKIRQPEHISIGSRRTDGAP